MDVEIAFGADDAGDEIGIEPVGAAGIFHSLIQIEGMRSDDGWLREWSGGWRVGHGFEVIDIGGGNVDEVGLTAIDVEASDGADGLAMVVGDGESVAQDGGVGGEGVRERVSRCNESELDAIVSSCGVLQKRINPSGAKARKISGHSTRR